MKPQTEPRYPILAVRVIVADREGRVLVLRRQNSAHGLGLWCLPGGKLECGETLEQAVLKELREETGLDCLEAQFLFYQDSLPPEPGEMHCVNCYFVCQALGEPRLNEESSAFRWVGPQDLGAIELAFRNQEALERYWRSDSAPAGLSADQTS